MEQPKKGEYWSVNNTSLTGKDNYSVVQILTNETPKFKNWRKHKYNCDSEGNEVMINGDYFVERMMPRVFSNPSKPA